MSDKSMMQKIDILFKEKAKEIKEKEEAGIKKSRKIFRVPRKVSAGAKRKIKQNQILVMFLSASGNLMPQWCKIEDEMVYIRKNDTWHQATNEYLMNFMGKYPTMLLPEWSMKPYSPREAKKEAEDRGEDISVQKFLIKIMKMTQAELKKKGFGGGSPIIWYIIGGVILIYMAMKAMGLDV